MFLKCSNYDCSKVHGLQLGDKQIVPRLSCECPECYPYLVYWNKRTKVWMHPPVRAVHEYDWRYLTDMSLVANCFLGPQTRAAVEKWGILTPCGKGASHSSMRTLHPTAQQWSVCRVCLDSFWCLAGALQTWVPVCDDCLPNKPIWDRDKKVWNNLEAWQPHANYLAWEDLHLAELHDPSAIKQQTLAEAVKALPAWALDYVEDRVGLFPKRHMSTHRVCWADIQLEHEKAGALDLREEALDLIRDVKHSNTQSQSQTSNTQQSAPNTQSQGAQRQAQMPNIRWRLPPKIYNMEPYAATPEQVARMLGIEPEIADEKTREAEFFATKQQSCVCIIDRDLCKLHGGS